MNVVFGRLVGDFTQYFVPGSGFTKEQFLAAVARNTQVSRPYPLKTSELTVRTACSFCISSWLSLSLRISSRYVLVFRSVL